MTTREELVKAVEVADDAEVAYDAAWNDYDAATTALNAYDKDKNT